MTQAQALGLLGALRAAFPRWRFDEESAAIYTQSLLDLDAEIATKAVHSLVLSSHSFPSIAEIREEFKRFWDTRERPRELERPELTAEEREMLAAKMRGLVERLGPAAVPVRVTEGLEQAPAGRCDDCAEKARLRWVLGKFTLCHGCVSSRKFAGARSAGVTAP
jgi:hypothetical protein